MAKSDVLEPFETIKALYYAASIYKQPCPKRISFKRKVAKLVLDTVEYHYQ